VTSRQGGREGGRAGGGRLSYYREHWQLVPLADLAATSRGPATTLHPPDTPAVGFRGR